ncbi:MAG: histidine phosphatase family protein [Prevotella sp.]|nr:histidine phosphatase family protein [Prevotella sp.]
MTTLYLTRHGETVDNANKIMQGQVQGELNEVGIRQAETLRDELAEVHFDAIVTSDLKRAIDTARIVAEPHGLEVTTTPLLRERDWGSFTGRYIPDLEHAVWPDDVEPLEVLKERAGRFLQFIRETYPDQQVLAVGHGIINKAVQAVLYGKQMNEVVRMTNAEVRILSI